MRLHIFNKLTCQCALCSASIAGAMKPRILLTFATRCVNLARASSDCKDCFKDSEPVSRASWSSTAPVLCSAWRLMNSSWSCGSFNTLFMPFLPDANIAVPTPRPFAYCALLYRAVSGHSYCCRYVPPISLKAPFLVDYRSPVSECHLSSPSRSSPSTLTAQGLQI